MRTALVGREGELDVLRRTLAHAAAGRTGAAMVTGEAGSGKSALLLEAARSWHSGPVLRATGYEPMRSIPLAAMGDLLRRLVAVPQAGDALERLVFSASGDSADPLRIFEAAHRALCALDPVLIVADDLQWFDERSLALLQYLLRAAASGGRSLAILAAARPSGAARGLQDAMHAELAADRGAVVELGPLGVDDGVALVRSIDASVDEQVAAGMWRAARGSPFWLEALARRHGGGGATSVIERRLQALGADASTLLGLLAVAARPLPVEDLAPCLGGEPERVRHALRELSVQGLAAESAGDVRTAHDLIRDEVVRLLPAGARRRLDAALSGLLEAAAGDDALLLVEALEHRVAASQPAVELASRILAAPNARRLGLANLTVLASVSDAVPPGSAEALRLDTGIAALAAALGAQEVALDRWDRVAARCDGGGPDRVHAEIGAARAAFALNRRERAHAHIDRARSLHPDDPGTLVEMDALEAQVELWLDHRTADGSRRAGRGLQAARDLARRAGGIDALDTAARRAYLAALQAAGDGALQENRSHDMAALGDEAVEVARGLGEAEHISALLRSALAQRHLLHLEEAQVRFRTALEMARRAVLPAHEREAGHGLCLVLRDLGRLEEARSVGSAAAALAARAQTVSRHWQQASAVLHSVDLYLGDTDTALQALRREAGEVSDPHFRLAFHATVAFWQARHLGARAAREVEAQVDLGLACARSAGCPRCTAEFLLLSAETLARTGNPRRARELLDTAAADGVRADPLRALWSARAAAMVALAEGDTGAACAALAELGDATERHGMLLDAVWTRIDHARALAATDRRQAVAILTAAAATVERTGAVTQGRIVARELRRLGVRAWRRGPAGGDDRLAVLSAREREVVELLAAGRSNAEIADALVVSPKTVERHVTNLLAKLSLRNRTEVAALARTPGGYGVPPMNGRPQRT